MGLADGTYVVVSALDAGKALDVAGGSDESGANVWLYGRNGTDAQVASVRTVRGRRMVSFPLTGKALDVAGGAFADGTNVRQWDANGTAAQAWEIAEDGGTLEVDGAALATYTVKCAASAGFALDVSGGSSSPRANVQIYAANGTDAQRWAFAPLDAVADGLYSIHSAMDPEVVAEVRDGSKSNGANVQLAAYDGGNGQVWRVSSSGGATQLVNTDNMSMYVVGAAADGANVAAWKASDNSDQDSWWVVEADGTMERNGCLVPACKVRNRGGSGFRLDAAGGGHSVGTNLQVYHDNGTAAQRWEFRPTERLSAGLSTPTDCGVAWSVGGAKKTGAWMRGAESVHPTWVCDAAECQMRWRSRYRSASMADGERGAWSAWKSIADGSAANGGWGEHGKPNLAAEKAGGRWYAPAIEAALSPAGHDLAEIQYQVRRFDASAPAHGHIGGCTYRCLYAPSLAVTGATWTPEGLRLSYESDLPRGNNALALSGIAGAGGELLASPLTLPQMDSSGYALVPQASLLRVPEDGEALEVSYQWKSVDGAYVDGTVAAVAAAHAGGSIAPAAPDVEVTAEGMLRVAVQGDPAEAYVWVPTTGGMHTVEGGEALVPVPFGEACRVHVLAVTEAGWYAWEGEAPAVMDDAYAFNFADSAGAQRCARILVGAGGPPSHQTTVTPDFEDAFTNGSPYSVVTFGGARKQSLSVEGALAEGHGGTAADFEALLDAHWAWLRTPRGGLFRVAVTGLTLDRTDARYDKVTVDCLRVDWR